MSVLINIEELKQKIVPKLIDEYHYHGEDIECEECDGDGFVVVPYTLKKTGKEVTISDVICPICRGSGFSSQREEIKTGKQIHDPESLHLLLDTGFQYRHLNMMIKACDVLGIKSIKKVWGHAKTQNYFKAGDFTFVLSPYVFNEWDMDKFQKIEL